MLEHLDPRRYRPVVGLVRPNPRVARFYEDAGVEVIEARGIEPFEHTTAEWASPRRPDRWPQALRTALGWQRSLRRTLEVVGRVRPALVHLNSTVLLPCAASLHRAGVPFVWHVRESPVHGLFGLRTTMLRRALARLPGRALYLSEAARTLWGGDPSGAVVGEFVDLERFHASIDAATVRRRLALSPSAHVVLFAGGISEIKGIVPLLQALTLLARQDPEVVCLMPGANLDPPSSLSYAVARRVLPALGTRTLTERVTHLLDTGRLRAVCRMLPFTSDMADLLAASDLLVFPSLVDHFARPVVEAGAMMKPVVATKFPTLEGQVRHGESGLLVEPGAAEKLAESMLALLHDSGRRAAMGRAGRDLAQAHNTQTNTEAVMEIYDELLGVG
jgi:glycosyltransferase involved in cell wall biosynthesis